MTFAAPVAVSQSLRPMASKSRLKSLIAIALLYFSELLAVLFLLAV